MASMKLYEKRGEAQPTSITTISVKHFLQKTYSGSFVRKKKVQRMILNSSVIGDLLCYLEVDLFT